LISEGALIAGAASFLLALLISSVLTPIVTRWARRRGFIDHPLGADSHKTHKVATPFGGGVAITIAIVLPLLVVLQMARMLSGVEPD